MDHVLILFCSALLVLCRKCLQLSCCIESRDYSCQESWDTIQKFLLCLPVSVRVSHFGGYRLCGGHNRGRRRKSKASRAPTWVAHVWTLYPPQSSDPKHRWGKICPLNKKRVLELHFWSTQLMGTMLYWFWISWVSRFTWFLPQPVTYIKEGYYHVAHAEPSRWPILSFEVT